jgi:hypothetical protein
MKRTIFNMEVRVSRSVLVSVRILLALLLSGCVLVQGAAGPTAVAAFGGAEEPVLVALLFAGVVCVEAVIVATWMLLTPAFEDRLFDAEVRADVWVDLAIGAFVAGSALAAAAAVYAVAVVGVPILVLALALGALGSASLAIVVSVMRRLLHTAVRHRSELAEVV